MGILDFIKNLNDSADEANAGMDKLTSGVIRTANPQMTEADALARAARNRELAESGGQMTGAINIVRSPEAAALKRAREAMTAIDPIVQKNLAQKLSSVVVEPLALRTGEVIYPRQVLEKFKNNIIK